jgi:hypothetical protein
MLVFGSLVDIHNQNLLLIFKLEQTLLKNAFKTPSKSEQRFSSFQNPKEELGLVLRS